MPSSSASTKPDLSRCFSASASKAIVISDSTKSKIKDNNVINGNTGASDVASMTVDGLLRYVYAESPSSEITLVDTTTMNENPILAPFDTEFSSSLIGQQESELDASMHKTVDDVWKEIVTGNRKECKEEVIDEIITLEDFLARAGAGEVTDEVTMPSPPGAESLSGGVFALDPIQPTSISAVEGGVIGFANGIDLVGGVGRGKRRAASVLEPMDKAAQQRQRRMIKNRESAARSRERRQAYQVELESMVSKLEEENVRLLKEKEERTKQRYKLLMEKVIPVVEQKRPARVLRRVRSIHW